ncbi:MAG: tail fiber domain-containing protein [Micavibrio aeruginosavorus]|nr:tail fiber domain-containing protein [Micavibrio aeruginosavorus]
MMKYAVLLFLLACFLAHATPALAQFPPVGGGGTCVGMTNEEGFQGQQSASNNGLYLCSGGVWVQQPLILGTTAAACSATWAGGIRYSGGAIQYCNGTSWANIGGGGGTPAGADREIQFNSGGAFGSSSTFKLMSDGDLLLTGTYTGTASVPVSGAGTRMFFDTQKAAFRVGSTSGANWDNGNIGNYSMAFGFDTMASGTYSVAMGAGTAASASYSTAMGIGTVANGWYSTAMGNSTTASGIASVAMGHQVYAGNGTAGSGQGDGSLAFGLIDDAVTISTRSQVTGIQSLGIFMGDQDGLVMSAANTMGLFGGKMVIDPAVPATQLTARGVIDAGAATDAIVLPSGTTAQRPGTPVNGMTRYNSTTSKFEAYQAGAWVDMIGGFKLMADGDLLLTGTYTGTASVPVSGAGTRMFFDTQKAAFRAGNVGGTVWDNANIGNYSVALGNDVRATGASSVALGSGAIATGDWSAAIGASVISSGVASIALGGSTNASGQYATTMGDYTLASGVASTAMGRNVTAGNGTAGSGQGDGSVAFGLIDNAVTITTRSQVTGIQSMGIFMGDQDGLVMSAANTMGLFGGKMVIDPAVPATQLTARGVIDAGAATDAIVLPSGTTAQRPGTPVNGMTRYNSTTSKFEAYQAGAWVDMIGGGGGGTPAGADTQVQFNNAGAFGADSAFVWNATSNYLGIGVTPNVALDVSGNIEYTGVITDVSDRRLKTDVLPLQNRGSMLKKLDMIDTYSFRMKDDKTGQIEFGVMAQDIKKIFPELVRIDTSTPENYMSVNYIGMIAPLISATKELKAENDTLRDEITTLKATIRFSMLFEITFLTGVAGLAIFMTQNYRRKAR